MMSVEKRFQFHKGSIKTFALDKLYRTTIGFNSTKVRLRRGELRYTKELARFQFHKGSIKT